MDDWSMGQRRPSERAESVLAPTEPQPGRVRGSWFVIRGRYWQGHKAYLQRSFARSFARVLALLICHDTEAALLVLYQNMAGPGLSFSVLIVDSVSVQGDSWP